MRIVRMRGLSGLAINLFGCFRSKVDIRFWNSFCSGAFRDKKDTELIVEQRHVRKVKFKYGKKTYFLLEPLKSDKLSCSASNHKKCTENPDCGTHITDGGLPIRHERGEEPSEKVVDPNVLHSSQKCEAHVNSFGLTRSLEDSCLAEQDVNLPQVTVPIKTSRISSRSSKMNDDILQFPFLGSKPPLCNSFCQNVLKVPYSTDDQKKPSVSHILKTTMSSAAVASLSRWEETMIGRLGEDGFLKYKNGILQRGKDLHTLIEKFFMNGVSEVASQSPHVISLWQSVEGVLQAVKCSAAVESHVVHPQLSYRGVVDCIAEYRGQPVVIEWKHSEKKKFSLLNTYDNPIQLMAYMGAINYDHHYPYQVEGCVLVIAYTDGSAADVYHLNKADQSKYWCMWLNRLKLYLESQRDLNESGHFIKRKSTSVAEYHQLSSSEDISGSFLAGSSLTTEDLNVNSTSSVHDKEGESTDKFNSCSELHGRKIKETEQSNPQTLEVKKQELNNRSLFNTFRKLWNS